MGVLKTNAPMYELDKSECDCYCKLPVLIKGDKDNVFTDNVSLAVIAF